MKDTDNTTSHKSDEYDSQIEDIIPYYSIFHREIINLIKSLPVEPKNWMDTGCGTGTLVKMARGLFPRTRFYLLDPSEGMLNEAQKKLSDIPADWLKLLKPSPTQNFTQKLEDKMDVITAIQCHHYLSPVERKKAIKVCYNLLNEDGVYITFENIKPLTREGIEIGKGYWGNFQLARGRDVSMVDNHLNRFNVEYFPITVEKHLELLRGAGFRVVELLWFSYMQAGFYCLK